MYLLRQSKIIQLIFLFFIALNLTGGGAYKMNESLGNQFYAQKFFISVEIENLYKTLNIITKDNADKIAANLSLLLIASAMQGDAKLYEKILMQTKNALNAISETQSSNKASYKSWLWGRVLLSANYINDKKTFVEAKHHLKKLLQTDQDFFTEWALGYLVSADFQEYQIHKQKMILTIENYSHSCFLKPESLRGELSNILWVLIMDLQAAANAKDKETYYFILTKMKLITGQETILDSLSKHLLRTSDSNDYPAWALSIIRLSAAVIGDEKLYQQLENPMNKALQEAKKTGTKSEEILAVLNNVLAKLRYKQSENIKINNNDYQPGLKSKV